MSGSTKEWIRPDEFMKIQRKKQQLQRRINQTQPTQTSQQSSLSQHQNSSCNQKRSNPFVKSSQQDSKKHCHEDPISVTEDTIFELIHSTKTKETPHLEAPLQEKQPVIQTENDEDESNKDEIPKPSATLPIDWSIKHRLRILCKTQIVGNNLKSSQEASGMTGFVRCLDITNTTSGLDISDGARFHQNLLYWQYPHLPWLNLVQRKSSANNEFKMNEKESSKLLNDWMECFLNLFQLLRARQCPYFYVLANQFTVLFRAAGIGGCSEMHAFLTPTTRGFRQLLKDEDIEFTQPLKKSSKEGNTPNTSVDEKREVIKNSDTDDGTDEDDEMDEMTFLASLGVNSSDIKFKDDIKARQKELEDDNGELSTVFFEGVDCQAFFNFLLNAKSTVPKVGRLAGVPPTLLAPVAFLGATMRKQHSRTSKLRLDGADYFSIELRNAILPHTIHTLCALLSEIKDSYSLTMVNYQNTVAFTKSSKKLLEDLDSSQAVADHVFGRENLSDCGIQNSVLEGMCRVDGDAVNILERLQYNKENGGYFFL